MWLLGIQTWVLMLVWQALYPLSHFSSCQQGTRRPSGDKHRDMTSDTKPLSWCIWTYFREYEVLHETSSYPSEEKERLPGTGNVLTLVAVGYKDMRVCVKLIKLYI